MSKTRAATCEICGGKLIFRNANNFECENCGANYPTAWVKEKVQEITGTVRVEGEVEVTGIESADALYKRGLDWLNINNMVKAAETFEEMTEKYPGDKRGWAKRTHMWPVEDNMIYARQFGEAIEAEAVAYIQNLYNQIIHGSLEKDKYRIFAVGGYDDFRILPNEYQCAKNYAHHSRQMQNFIDNAVPYAKDLHEKSKENARYINDLIEIFIVGTRVTTNHREHRSKWFNKLLEVWGFEPFNNGYLTRVKAIIGQIIIFECASYDSDNWGSPPPAEFLCDFIITKSEIQESFYALDNLLFKGKHYKNGFCVKCGSVKKTSLWSGIHCPVCKIQ